MQRISHHMSCMRRNVTTRTTGVAGNAHRVGGIALLVLGGWYLEAGLEMIPRSLVAPIRGAGGFNHRFHEVCAYTLLRSHQLMVEFVFKMSSNSKFHGFQGE